MTACTLVYGKRPLIIGVMSPKGRFFPLNPPDIVAARESVPGT
jgi:hypothetical protein